MKKNTLQKLLKNRRLLTLLLLILDVIVIILYYKIPTILNISPVNPIFLAIGLTFFSGISICFFLSLRKIFKNKIFKGCLKIISIFYFIIWIIAIIVISLSAMGLANNILVHKY